MLPKICRGVISAFKIVSVRELPLPRSMASRPTFPKTIEGFGYNFNPEGRLRKIDPKSGQLTDAGFEFNASSDPSYNQRHYEALGEVVTEKVYQLLDQEGLKRLPVPPGSSRGSFIFATENALDAGKLMLLIHGSGVVRAGQWARSLIINDCLDSGTQIPYIRKAVELGYGVIVFNTNDNYEIVNGSKAPKEGSATSQEHAVTVWQNYVQPAKAHRISIVAHSYGGIITMALATHFADEFMNRVFAVALTDSVHGRIPRSSKFSEHMTKVGRNWVSSSQPLDTLVSDMKGEIPCYSAGTGKHEMTSWSCIGSLFNFVEDCYHASVEAG